MKKIAALSLVLATLITAEPYITPMVTGDITGNPGIRRVDETAAQNRERRVRERREYNRAVDIYNYLIDHQRTPDLQPPNQNDRETVLFYLNSKWNDLDITGSAKVIPEEPEEIEVEVEAQPVELTVDDLNESQRIRLRYYQRAGTCPETLVDYLPGFYDLCKSVVRYSDRSQRRQGILDRLIRGRYRHTAAPQSFQLQKIQELMKQEQE